jgi:DNA helicase-2/ATP-dependent DNA helicase PcrA
LKLEINDRRRAILNQAGHMLVCGGPGSGKTTIALLKAKERCPSLAPGQGVLFLSFSRAAVRQVLGRCKSILSPSEQRLIDVKTYHAFCMEILKSHGKLIKGCQCRFVLPADELIDKSTFDGDWASECKRRAVEEGSFCFDLFAWGAAALFERSRAVRDLYGSRYPLVVIDEFQDTDDDQWRIVREFAVVSDVFCLADPEQRIFEYRSNVDPKRVESLRQSIKPSEHDLGQDNHRSADAGILDFADAVLYNRAPLPVSEDVKFISYYPNNFPVMFHAGVVWTFSRLRKRKISRPCVAILARSNSLVANLSRMLSEPHVYDNRTLAPIEHDVAWDADLSVASAAVVGSVMEWQNSDERAAVSKTLGLITQYFRLKNAAKSSKAAAENIRKFEASKEAIALGIEPKFKSARALLEIFRSGIAMAGDPVGDWKRARTVLEQIKDLNDLYRDVRMVRLFGARDALATGLASVWLSSGSYADAATLVKKTLDQERLIASDREPRGCILMNIHKSKGKEFDAVVLVEGTYAARFFDRDREKFPFQQSRRLFRVAVTRARSMVTIIRPMDALPLVGPE